MSCTQPAPQLHSDLKSENLRT